jgi:hypothetical protein
VGVNIIAVSYIQNARKVSGQHRRPSPGIRLPERGIPPPPAGGVERNGTPQPGQPGQQSPGYPPPPGQPEQQAPGYAPPPEQPGQQTPQDPQASVQPPRSQKSPELDTPPPDEALNEFVASYSATQKDPAGHINHYCPGCGTFVGKTDPCPSCGYSIKHLKTQKVSGRTCPQGTYNKEGWKYCWKHGEKL